MTPGLASGGWKASRRRLSGMLAGLNEAQKQQCCAAYCSRTALAAGVVQRWWRHTVYGWRLYDDKALQWHQEFFQVA